MQIRDRLRYMRVLYGLSQKNVADYLGCTKQYITQLETNKLTATEEKLEQILNAIYFLGEQKKQGRLKEILEDIKNQNLNNL